MTNRVSAKTLIEMMKDARIRTLGLISDLNESQLMGPQLATVNPLLWEIGHVAYFYEYFFLRKLLGLDSFLKDKADALYDSIKIKSIIKKQKKNIKIFESTYQILNLKKISKKKKIHFIFWHWQSKKF